MSEKDSWQLVKNFVSEVETEDVIFNEILLDNPDTTIRGVKHKTKDGGVVQAVSVQLSRRVYFFYEGIGIYDSALRSSRVLELDNSDESLAVSVNLIAVSNGEFVTELSAKDSTVAGGCDVAECRKKGRCYGCSCTSWDLKCLVNCCGPCALSCGAAWSCLACVGIWCILCSTWSNPCCRATTCTYIDRPSCP